MGTLLWHLYKLYKNYMFYYFCKGWGVGGLGGGELDVSMFAEGGPKFWTFYDNIKIECPPSGQEKLGTRSCHASAVLLK